MLLKNRLTLLLLMALLSPGGASSSSASYELLGNGRCANDHSHGTMAYRAKEDVSPTDCKTFCTNLNAQCTGYALECGAGQDSCGTTQGSYACLVYTSEDMTSAGFSDTQFQNTNDDFSAPTGVDSYLRGYCYKKASSSGGSGSSSHSQHGHPALHRPRPRLEARRVFVCQECLYRQCNGHTLLVDRRHVAYLSRAHARPSHLRD